MTTDGAHPDDLDEGADPEGIEVEWAVRVAHEGAIFMWLGACGPGTKDFSQVVLSALAQKLIDLGLLHLTGYDHDARRSFSVPHLQPVDEVLVHCHVLDPAAVTSGTAVGGFTAAAIERVPDTAAPVRVQEQE